MVYLGVWGLIWIYLDKINPFRLKNMINNAYLWRKE